ncbi:Hsp70 family protein [Stieleria sp. TO1_6]|uniref:Hsp70 family protein n=1 Tax=Stieleria tagensis TaxID=2956795 RepID=UPI00209B8898|nr:Hsp70 family protein [Stieleria tagensis]MCO8124847.1 Hsp70 family protein [Stieleria tagensis]
MTQTKPPPAVGIDLGTTFSAVAYLNDTGRPETIRNSEGDLTTPSAVFFDQRRPIVGIEAVEAGLLEPDRLALYAKRDVGEAYYEKQIRGKNLPAEVIQALVLRKLKADAELKLGPISQAVITVPAFFNEPCRKATQDAGRLAGLDVLDIINEPTAAAITYGVEQGFLSADGKDSGRETVLVYDLGGGTFDVTVMQIENGHFNTIATAGDVYLGGIDWDNRIVDFIAEAFQAEHGVDPREDPQAMQELVRKANQTKHALTQRDSVSVAFAHDGKRLRTELAQQEFAQRCDDLVERTLMTVQLVLDDAGIGWPDLTRLILVGGSTRMPMVRDELERLSGMELDRSLSPDEAVSHGAALYAGMLLSGGDSQANGISVSNVNSHDLGVLAVDPVSGKPRRQIMIPRNSRLPARKKVRFRTHSDNQANVKIEIVEGGDDRGTNATKIGKCVVDDIPRGTPKGTNVDVRFDYTADGRLTVHASLPEVDRKIKMTLDRASGLSEEDIEIWTTRLSEGFSDAMLADLAAAVVASNAVEDNDDNASQATSEQPDFSPADAVKPAAETIQQPSTKTPQVAAPQAIDSQPKTQSPAATRTPDPAAASAKPVPSNPKPSDDQPDFAAILNPGGSEKKTAPVVLPDVLGTAAGSGANQIKEKPQLKLDPKDSAPAVKADSNDLAMLAALGGSTAKPAPSSADIPMIVTDSPAKPTAGNKSEPQKQTSDKKQGGFFSRKKK